MKRIINKLLFRIKNSGVHLGHNITISRKTKAGLNCHLADSCSLSNNVVLGNNVKVGNGAILSNISVGNNSMIESGVKVVGTGIGKINIGKECYIGANNILDSSNDITIGDFVHIAGPSTSLWCHSSVQMSLNNIPLNDPGRDKYRPTASIVIKDNVYIGGNCTIYPGVVIGYHSIIAPNSVVTKNVEPHTMVGGVPAKEIKKINIESYS